MLAGGWQGAGRRAARITGSLQLASISLGAAACLHWPCRPTARAKSYATVARTVRAAVGGMRTPAAGILS